MMHTIPRAAIFGELLIDHKTIDGKELLPSPGGPPIFISHTLHNEGIDVFILTHVGKDYPKEWIPRSTQLFPKSVAGKQNPRYFLKYHNNSRSLRVNDRTHFRPVLRSEIDAGSMKKLERADMAFFASTLPIYSPHVIHEWIEMLQPRHTILLLQGWLREASERGDIRKRNPKEIFTWLDHTFDEIELLVLSHQDHEASVVEEIKRRYSKRSMVAITKGIEGAVIVYKGQEIDVPTSWPVYNNEEELFDTTGAGDRWAAAFSYYAFIEKHTVGKSAEKAHHAVASYLKQS